MQSDSAQPSLRSRKVRGWVGHLWREWTVESWRPIAPAFARPTPAEWDDTRVTAAWLGHATVLLNFYGVKIITDPVLFPRIGIRFPGFTIGPKRLTAPALTVRELPQIDVVLLSHAHFDHIDMRTLHYFNRHTRAVTALRTGDLLRWTKFGEISELRWGQGKTIETAAGALQISAFPVKHWGARMRRDMYRGYNGYVIERAGHKIIFGGDTALTDTFGRLRDRGPYDLAIMSVGAYDPWIRSHCSPEQAVQMATEAGAKFVMPVHHQTFRLSFEPFREPIERFEAALRDEPGRVALREIGETFVLPL